MRQGQGMIYFYFFSVQILGTSIVYMLVGTMSMILYVGTIMLDVICKQRV